MQRRSFPIPEKSSGFLAALVVAGALIIGACFTPAEAGKLYRWVDEDGQVHFSDKVPPEHIRQQRDELNERGMVVRTVEKAKTPEQLAEEKRQAELREEAEARRREAELHDQWLTSTFRNEQDLIESRDDKLATLEAATRLTEERIERLRNDLQRLRSQAADHERGGSTVPDDLLDQINSIERQITENREFVLRKTREQQELRARYARDVERFRELRATRKTASPATTP